MVYYCYISPFGADIQHRGGWFAPAENWKLLSKIDILSKDTGANQLRGFFIIRLPSMDNLWNVNINVSIGDYSCYTPKSCKRF